MSVTSYYSFGGEIIGEETGGVRRDYLTDALGSVTATVTEAGVIENTYRYKPYGEQLMKTGGGSNPRFSWVGTYGYRSTGDIFSKYYVRRRHYDSLVQWTSIDPIGYFDDIMLYQYVVNNPITLIDPSGLQFEQDKQKPCLEMPEKTPGKLCDDAKKFKNAACGIPSSCRGSKFNAAWNKCKADDKCKCALAKSRMAASLGCFSARQAVTLACYGGISDRCHFAQEGEVLSAYTTCQERLLGINCEGGNGPKRPIRQPGIIPVVQPIRNPGSEPIYIPFPIGRPIWQPPPPEPGKIAVCGTILLTLACYMWPPCRIMAMNCCNKLGGTVGGSTTGLVG
jgi:RHS repeat-associated protein